MDLATGCWSLNLLSEKMYVREQGFQTMNEAECSIVLAKALCSPSFAQKYIIAVSQCGSLGSVLAIKSEEQCRQSSAGKYCLSVDIGHITNCCGSSINCSIACRNCLTDFSCCLNT